MKWTTPLSESGARVWLTTGLGASLATIGRLKVVISLYIRDFYVVTSRCANIFWTTAYTEVLHAHWRVAIQSDIVTTLSKAGYTHASKRVALIASGEMFLDPNAIEPFLWSSAPANVTEHSKSAYKKALTLFSTKYLDAFVPEFIDKELEAPCVKELEF